MGCTEDNRGGGGYNNSMHSDEEELAEFASKKTERMYLPNRDLEPKKRDFLFIPCTPTPPDAPVIFPNDAVPPSFLVQHNVFVCVYACMSSSSSSTPFVPVWQQTGGEGGGGDCCDRGDRPTPHQQWESHRDGGGRGGRHFPKMCLCFPPPSRSSVVRSLGRPSKRGGGVPLSPPPPKWGCWLGRRFSPHPPSPLLWTPSSPPASASSSFATAAAAHSPAQLE